MIVLYLTQITKLIAILHQTSDVLKRITNGKSKIFIKWNAFLSADDCDFISSSWLAPLKLHVCPSLSHERPTSYPKGPRHRPASSGNLTETEERLTLEVGFCSHKSVLLSFSVLGKMQLCTQRRILTTKSRQPVRSSVLEPWGEDRRDWRGGGFDLRHCIDYSVPAFSSFVRFKISKVIVVGDLAVGKTCLINRWAWPFNTWMLWQKQLLEMHDFSKNLPPTEKNTHQQESLLQCIRYFWQIYSRLRWNNMIVSSKNKMIAY